MPSETEYFIISVPLPWFKVGGLRAPCGARPRGKYSSVLGSPCCCLPPMLKCQSPSDKCTKQFWVPTATTSPSLLDPPWQGELPGGSLARWLSPLAAAQGDLTESVPALPNCWRSDSTAFDPAHPCRTPTPHNPCHNAQGTPSQMPGTQQLPVGTEWAKLQREWVTSYV